MQSAAVQYDFGVRNQLPQSDTGNLQQSRVGQAVEAYADLLQQFSRQAGQQAVALRVGIETDLPLAEIAHVDVDFYPMLAWSEAVGDCQLVQHAGCGLTVIVLALTQETGLEIGGGCRSGEFQRHGNAAAHNQHLHKAQAHWYEPGIG
ncbi:hypothetical protein ALO75_200166 [Pseudomonas syringae pv. coryli]|uniref:Transposase n=1 Tax=Pseudomonas syringae pv. coryli TaxID=317659 RepID=A0A0P9S7I7_9PSED|nr:hypothetical protein ALO75_200166 [Pseudomonas syringae pv. coryli]